MEEFGAMWVWGYVGMGVYEGMGVWRSVAMEVWVYGGVGGMGLWGYGGICSMGV